MAPVRRANISAAAASSTGSLSVTIPAASQVGDVAVIFVWGSTSTALTGWTKLLNDGFSDTVVIFSKVLVAGDIGSTVTVAAVTRNSGLTVYALEVWGGVKSPPTATSAISTTRQFPTIACAVGSIPLLAAALVNSTSGTPPSTTTPGTGWTGSYAKTGTTTGDEGIGVWFGNPTTGTSTPSATTSSDNSWGGIYAVVALAPSQDQTCILAGATSAQDTIMQPILAGATSAQDTNLVWTA